MTSRTEKRWTTAASEATCDATAWSRYRLAAEISTEPGQTRQRVRGAVIRPPREAARRSPVLPAPLAGTRQPVEGGVSIFLFLLILAGAGIGGFLLFGTGGYLRRKQMRGELGDDDGDGRRPTHLRVEDDGDAPFEIPAKGGPGEKPPMPSE